MTYKELIPLLPNKWEDITLKNYINISEAIVSTDDDLDELEQSLQMVDNVFNIISRLTHISLNELMSIPTEDVSKVVTHMDFIFTDVVPNAVPHPKMKTDVDTTYSNYITFTNLNGELTKITQSLPILIESFLNDVPKEDIMNLNIVEVMTIFFCQVRLLKEYMTTTRQSLLWKIVKQRIKETLTLIRLRLMFWKKSK